MAKRRGKRQARPGAEVLAIRQQFGWSMREVRAATVALAKKHRQPAFVISPSRLHNSESKNKIPTMHRLYALARIYGRSLNELLSLYGIPKTESTHDGEKHGHLFPLQKRRSEISGLLAIDAPRCPKHSSKMICPQCIGSSGGRKTATKYKNRLSTWGKMGGRGKKNGLSLSRRAVPFEKGK
jgi:transcriptional regulator with XRE-family HTH domain